MDPYQTAIEERIREVQRYRRMIRRQEEFRFLDGFIDHYREEAGALNRVRNKARKATRVEARGDHFAGVGR
jgi:hypothetical protein